MNPNPPTLIGDGIENPWNALTMIHAAAMFGSKCAFLDRKDIQSKWDKIIPESSQWPRTDLEHIKESYAPRVAFDNTNNAEDVYGCRLPKGATPAVMVGNERRGLSHSVRALSDRAVQIPMASKTLNCLNVAAAAGVALYYLSRGGGGKMNTRTHPSPYRPELLLIGGEDHLELGSTIRSAGAFGWERIFVEDRFETWFGCDRVKRSESRAAARRGRNPVRLIPTPRDRGFVFNEIVVLTTRHQGEPMHRANLARGNRQLIVLADESRIDLDAEDWARLGSRVRYIHPELPRTDFSYHFRLPATIALAEAARQIGRPARLTRGKPKRHEPLFEHALRLLFKKEGEMVYLEDMADF